MDTNINLWFRQHWQKHFLIISYWYGENYSKIVKRTPKTDYESLEYDYWYIKLTYIQYHKKIYLVKHLSNNSN